MPIKFNEVTWYSKLGAAILFILVVPTLAFFIDRKYEEVSMLKRAVPPGILASTNTEFDVLASDPLNAEYSVDGVDVHLNFGKAEFSEMNGPTISKYDVFGPVVSGDLNGDGKTDKIFFLYQETSGSGTFFFAAAAIADHMHGFEGYRGLNTIFLGDRIAPQTITIMNGKAAVNYAIRRETDPMTAEPSVGVTTYVKIQNGKLTEDASVN